MRRIAAALCLTLAFAGRASAADISFGTGVSQDDFKKLVKDTGAALSYKNVAPAEPLGLLGFDVGLEAVGLSIGGTSWWDAATGGKGSDFVVVPKLRARKGLPFSIDVGAMYSAIPNSNVQLFGAELAYALMDGGVALPAIGLRATYTKLLGVSELDVQTAGVDATISKGFVILTPYAGIGALYTQGKAKGKILTDPIFIAVNGGKALEAEKLWSARYYGGVKLSPIPLFGITGEVEYSGVMTYSLKAAISF
jgi:hypothetical protein